MNPIVKKILRGVVIAILSPLLVFLTPYFIVFGLIQLIHGLGTFAFDGEWEWLK